MNPRCRAAAVGWTAWVAVLSTVFSTGAGNAQDLDLSGLPVMLRSPADSNGSVGGRTNSIEAITIDSDGNILVVGSYQTVVEVEGIPLVGQTTGANGFVAKLTSAGTLLWARNATGQTAVNLSDVDTDEDGNVYVVGNALFQGSNNVGMTATVTFGGLTLDVPGGNGLNVVGKLTASGEWEWIATVQASSSASGTAQVEVGSDGVLICAGDTIQQATSGNGGTSTSFNTQGNGFFLGELNFSGTWIRGTTSNSGSAGSCGAMTLDSSGAVYAAAGSNLYKFSAAGAVVISYSAFSSIDFISDITSDEFGGVYLVGRKAVTVDELRILKLSDGGTNFSISWGPTKIDEDTDLSTRLAAVDTDSQGNVYVGAARNLGICAGGTDTPGVSCQTVADCGDPSATCLLSPQNLGQCEDDQSPCGGNCEGFVDTDVPDCVQPCGQNVRCLGSCSTGGDDCVADADCEPECANSGAKALLVRLSPFGDIEWELINDADGPAGLIRAMAVTAGDRIVVAGDLTPGITFTSNIAPSEVAFGPTVAECAANPPVVGCLYPDQNMGGTDPSFIARATPDGEWDLPEVWTVGQEVPRPQIAIPQIPDIEIPGVDLATAASRFFWSEAEKKLYAVEPTSATVAWRVSTDPLDETRARVDGVSVFPSNPQLHTLTAPVDLELTLGDRCPSAASNPHAPCERNSDCGGSTCAAYKQCIGGATPWVSCLQDSDCGDATGTCNTTLSNPVCSGGSNAGFACDTDFDCAPTCNQVTYQGLLYSTNEASDANKTFNATDVGYSVLLYALGPVLDPVQYPVHFEVVRSVEASTMVGTTGSACTIGTPLGDTDHYHPLGKNGWPNNETSRFDGSGANPAFDREGTQLGPIIPVNEDTPAAEDDMIVSWYRPNQIGVSWPDKPVLYDCHWPTSPDKIVIASGVGSEIGFCHDDPADPCTADSDCPEPMMGMPGTCDFQPTLSPLLYPSARVYNQPDPELPGFNPNEEHALLVSSNMGTGVNALFALRDDLGSSVLSDPYVLLKYVDPVTSNWAMRVYHVVDELAPFTFDYDREVTQQIKPTYPLSVLPACAQSCSPTPDDCGTTPPSCGTDGSCDGGQLDGEGCTTDGDCRIACTDLCSGVPLYKDYRGRGSAGSWLGWWARSAGDVDARFFYPLQPGFYSTDLDLDQDTVEDAPGDCVPWLDRSAGTTIGTPVTVSYDIDWPSSPPVLPVGDTLITPKLDLPDLVNQAAARVIFEQVDGDADGTDSPGELAKMFDPLTERVVFLEELPDDLLVQSLGTRTQILGSDDGLIKVPFALRQRFEFDGTMVSRCDDGLRTGEGCSSSSDCPGGACVTGGGLTFKGVFDETGLGEPLSLINVMTTAERDFLLTLSSDSDFDDAVGALYDKTRNPNVIDASPDDDAIDQSLLIGFQPEPLTGRERANIVGPKALTAGGAVDVGHVTLVFNDDPLVGAPVSLSVLRVECGPVQGQVQVIFPDNVFEEQLTLRHSADFGGNPDSKDFEWYYALKEQDCASIPVPASNTDPMPAPWILLDGGNGVNEVTLEGPGVTTLADTCILARYTGFPLCSNAMTPSNWAGAPFGPTQAIDPKSQLAPGWLSRVVEGLNPFNARTTDFRSSEVNTFASALISAGERFEGPIAFNPDADAINDVGLIEAYTTALERGIDLSLDEGISIGAVNSRLLDVANRIAVLYMLLGNEAFADALDPTIGFDTAGVYGTLAPAIFAFQNQLDSLLAEELNLLRGRDDSGGARPVYNRLIWNFTGADGEVAYQQNYNVTDQNLDGFIDEFDARILFPQGHGDAWGHYLTAIKGYYQLLQEPLFEWIPRSDSVLVAGSEVLVDFTDERRFAEAAAARARTGAQIVDLTYRRRWVDDPNGQWQGYKDTDTDRGFGVFEWAQRAGTGAYFDWVVANGILPVQSDKPPGIEKIDRTTVPELPEIAANYNEIQTLLDNVDSGMNPLGLAKNVVPFDIDPQLLDDRLFGGSHFEQVAARAGKALDNAIRVFDFANELTQLLRRNQDSLEDFRDLVNQQERDYNNRLIETFGTPYREDIGPGGTYASGYIGPDIWNYDIVDQSAITGGDPGEFEVVQSCSGGDNDGLSCFTDTDCPDGSCVAAGSVTSYQLTTQVPQTEACEGDESTCRFDDSGQLLFDDDGFIVTSSSTVNIQISEAGLGRIKPSTWTLRESPGEIQFARSEYLETRARFEQAIAAYSALIGDIQCVLGTVTAQNNLAEQRLDILNRMKDTALSFNALIVAAHATELGLRQAADQSEDVADATIEAFPRVVGLSNDATSAARAAVVAASAAVNSTLDIAADVADASQLAFELAAEIEAQVDAIALQELEDDFEIFNLWGDLGAAVRQEPVLRLEALALAEQVNQAANEYLATVASGFRLLDELEAFRRSTAANVAESRYSDMAFRIFRNDALQKYRAQFDLAQRYVYLAATAYDYETNLLGSSTGAGQKFLTDIVKHRSLGQFIDGEPLAGSRGLADPMARMKENFEILKGQLGFNNPQTETNRFSLRREHFRVLDSDAAAWRAMLEQYRVADLWQVDDFRRFARPPAPEDRGPQPGIVIPFDTTVTFGLNFFGWPLGAKDSAYDATNFATKVRSVGVWFDNYDQEELSNTPRVYLIPAGADVLRTPDAFDFTTRHWTVIDQKIPTPFSIGATDLANPGWSPILDSLSGNLGEVRRFSSFRAFEDNGSLDVSELTTDSRAVGRSVWNTRWTLILAGGTLLNDADEGLNTLIYGRPLVGGPVVDPDGVERDGNGIEDILLFFQTYAFSGN